MFKSKSYNKSIFKLLLFVLTLSLAQEIWADDKAESENNKDATKIAKVDHPLIEAEIKDKYNLNDEQMTALKESGLPPQGMIKIAYLSKNSSKSISEILKMRNEQKMGWGKIAKELNIHPGDLGRAVASLRHDFKKDMEERHHERMEKHEKKMERKENRNHNKPEHK